VLAATLAINFAKGTGCAMFPEPDKFEIEPIEIPKVRRSPWGAVKIVAALLCLGGGAWAWHAGYRPANLFGKTASPVRFVQIGSGDIDTIVVETGTLESASNATVRCQVEALIGLVGGTGATTGTGKGVSGSTTGQAGGSAAGGSGAQAGASGTTDATGTSASGSASKSKAKATKKAGASSTSKTGTTGSTGSSSSSSTSGTSGSSASGTSTSGSSGSAGSSGSGGSGSSSSGASSSGGSSTTSSKPVIRSFAITVVAHTPLRPATPKAADATAAKKQTQGQGGGMGGGGGRGGGGGGRGGGRGGSGNMFEEEKPGSTRIVEILAEGSKVKAGDVVCRLDASSYEDEEKAQQIRFLQAKAYLDQAISMLDVAKISLEEYRDGIYPQDQQLVQQYMETCVLEKARLQRALAWSNDMYKKNFRTYFQVKGDMKAFEQSELALKEAQGMYDRLVKQTGPKLLKSLEANVRALESDKLTQEASFSLEKQRLERIRRNIAYCTVKAPGDGIVVYVNQSNRWGMSMGNIDQGVTLRQDQPIFNLPDPKHMRVKAKINESKVKLVHTGQAVLIKIDAYPERPLRGVVAEVMPISIPLMGSDVRVYYANVDILNGFDDLRPGLSAELVFEVESRRSVTRVPIESIRWVDDEPYVALFDHSAAENGKPPWKWQPIQIGLSDYSFAEVLNGLKVGDRVVSLPADLPAPRSESQRPTGGTAVTLSSAPN
jgi:multidrug resistance efflux pump